MTLVTRAGKGSELTWPELDNNFAHCLSRGNHTGTQLAETISDFGSATRAQVEAELVAGSNITITPSGTGATRQLTLSTPALPTAQVVAFAGTSKTLALTDINTIVDCTSSSAVTITIPPQSSVAWTADAEIHVRMSGTGGVSIAVGSGVTVPPLTAPLALGGQGAVVTLKRRSSDVWAVIGLTNVEAVVRATPLTGLVTTNNSAVVATDTVLVGFGKLQAQVGAMASALDTINGVVI